MNLRFVTLLLVLGCAACDETSSSEPEDAPKQERAKRKKRKAHQNDAEVDVRALIAWLQDSQRAGVVERDVRAFLKIWSDDARLVHARTEKPSPYDIVADRAAFEKSARMQARGERDYRLDMRHEDEEAEVTDEGEVVIRWTVRASWKQGAKSGSDTSREIFRLRKTDEGWRVYENRFWPLASEVDGEVTRYDAAFWAKQDAEVDKLQPSDPPGEQLALLFLAGHYERGYTYARELTEKNPRQVEAWGYRATFARKTYRMDDSVAAYKRLEELDPKARIPEWARVD